MEKFAFIFHPHDIPSLGDWVLEEPNLKKKRIRVIERSLRWFPPFKRETVTGLKSIDGKEIEGDMILWAMIPEQILNMDPKFTIGRLIEAGKVAQDLGAKIIGLGAYAAWIGRRGIMLSKAVDIAVTTGTSYTIVTVVDAILVAAEKIGINISDARVGIIGATGSIGSVVAKLMTRYAHQLTLVSRNIDKLEELVDSLEKIEDKKVSLFAITDDIKKVLQNSDVVVIITNTPTTVISIDDVLPGTILCDISLPHNVSEEEAERRNDLLVIDGGIVQPPGNVDFHFSFGLPPGLAYACMAETMILTFEGIFENYSIGGNSSIEKVEKISYLGKKHGFKLADFKSFGKEVSEEKLDMVRKAVVFK
jgi:predicted amino acid dehydrogenase